MLRKLLLPFFVLCAIFLVGCSKTDTMNNSNSTATNGNKPATTTNSSSSTTNSKSSSTSSAEKIGVPDCDDFLTKYDACVSGKVPAAQQAQYKDSIEQSRKAYRLAAANPMTKAALAAQCKQALDSAKTSMKSYGCEF